MLGSYALDEDWVKSYIRQGMERLRQMEQETARKVAGNARDIREMMQAAYDERQMSQDYLDYKHTQTIRGEQDWISSMEVGTVYHTDSWGTRNTTTGETWEGQPNDHVRFTGRSPKHGHDADRQPRVVGETPALKADCARAFTPPPAPRTRRGISL